MPVCRRRVGEAACRQVCERSLGPQCLGEKCRHRILRQGESRRVRLYMWVGRHAGIAIGERLARIAIEQHAFRLDAHAAERGLGVLLLLASMTAGIAWGDMSSTEISVGSTCGG